MPLEILKVHFDCAESHRIWLSATGAGRDCALVAVPCAFSDMVVTFRGRRKEKPRALLVVQKRLYDRRTGSERLYFKMQISLLRRNALAGRPLEVQISWQAHHFVNLNC